MRSAPSITLVSGRNSKSVTKTRPSATTGPAKPPLTGVRQTTFRPSAGNRSMMPSSVHTPTRPAPRHSGQSAANSDVPTSAAHSTAVTHSSRNVRIVVFPSDSLAITRSRWPPATRG